MKDRNKKTVFIRGDLNSLQNGYIPLRNHMWLDVIKYNYGDIYDGMKIWMYEKTRVDGKLVPTVFQGVIRIISSKSEYSVEVDESQMQYYNQIAIFKDYTLEDIISEELYPNRPSESGGDNQGSTFHIALPIKSSGGANSLSS